MTRRQYRIPERPRRAPRGPRLPATVWGKVLGASGAVVVLLILWAIIASLSAKTDTTATAPAAEGLTPSASYKSGDCFSNFDASAQANRVVPCTQAHSAQLVATAMYGAGGSYPGKDALEQRASDLCRQTQLTLPQDTSTLRQRNAFPSQSSWSAGDRRVDCFVESTKGNTLTASLLP
ncbi:septum formation family protein [Sinomonas susongensis]|uniref:septum formation family protein n=1 Tax=Sinomonas susongensis TaxID=1324851 RepID=UPI001BB11537|nr:septum formation family protein [Sinomonas susongensis]